MYNMIVGFGLPPKDYVINGVRYRVESRFVPFDLKSATPAVQLNDRLEKYLSSDFTDLPCVDKSGKIDGEYVCSAAGEEDINAVEN